VPSTLGVVASAQNFPLSLSPALWLDAADTSTITESSGSVSQWASKAGGYNAVQSTGANQPTTGSATINGRNVIVFDGSTDSLSVANFDLTPGGQKFSVAIVATAASGGDRIFIEQTTNFNNNLGAFVLARTSTNVVELGKRGASFATFATSGTLTTAAKAFVGTHDGTLSTNETSGWLNGDGSGTRANGNTNSNNLNATLFIGARAGTSLYLNGQIAEIVVTTYVLTTQQRTDLESYFTTKWGL
jgi:hypothetical protein